MLLFLGNSSIDFSSVAVILTEYIIVCSSQEHLCKYVQSSIGLACLMQALQKINYLDFAAGLM